MKPIAVFVGNKCSNSFIKTITEGFEVGYLEIEHMGQLPVDDKEVIFFHPRVKDMNPQWLTEDRVENFTKFEFPDNAYYVFAADYGDIIDDIGFNAPNLAENSRWVKIPTKKNFKSLNGHIAAGIVFWEYFKRKGELSL